MLNTTQDVISNQICQFISENYLKEGGEIDAHTPIIDLNIIDSASLFDVVDFILSEFEIRIPFDEIHPENFKTIAILGEAVLKISKQGVQL